MKNLTKRQREVFHLLCRKVCESEFLPTHKTMALELGITSKPFRLNLLALEKKKAIKTYYRQQKCVKINWNHEDALMGESWKRK